MRHYHCGMLVPCDSGSIPFEATEYKTVQYLCGAEATPTDEWDHPWWFLGDEFIDDCVRCEACMNHPDLPLLLLGES